MTYNPEWRAEDEQRVRTLDELYFQDGRDKRDHPMHSTYTGLWQQHQEQASE